MKLKDKWLSINRKHRTYWVTEEEDAYIRKYLEENRKRIEAESNIVQSPNKGLKVK